ncbi:hypothetical protein PV336_15840 [Streptomyces sp. MI02-2A]|uniref:hypothetical protein n=1 Tax=Streptomyces sp. MI02-2A TaxID=3028688 RepID=UPI0029BCEA26|nr:hypothetical protein [Streptomyces sp. MI02-2A]MDX3260691.1 hypothetical protein [Streptomyces sp. MI02-2A]
MATIADLRTRVRSELGDRLLPFRDTLRGTGDVSQYELSANNIEATGFAVEKISGTTNTTLTSPADYVLDALNGILDLTAPLVQDDLLLVSGHSYGLFSDDELDQYVNDALAQHNRGRATNTRYRDENGFIKYDKTPIDVFNLPPEEDLLVVLLATTEALWALSTDAATDINVQTSDGTTVDRGQRFAQIQTQIGALTDRYKLLCEKLGVGLFSIEVSNLRRVSRTTNRLVPLFREKEYDDYSLPDRIIPPSQPGNQNDDESGIPSQTWGGWF